MGDLEYEIFRCEQKLIKVLDDRGESYSRKRFLKNLEDVNTILNKSIISISTSTLSKIINRGNPDKETIYDPVRKNRLVYTLEGFSYFITNPEAYNNHKEIKEIKDNGKDIFWGSYWVYTLLPKVKNPVIKRIARTLIEIKEKQVVLYNIGKRYINYSCEDFDVDDLENQLHFRLFGTDIKSSLHVRELIIDVYFRDKQTGLGEIALGVYKAYTDEQEEYIGTLIFEKVIQNKNINENRLLNKIGSFKLGDKEYENISVGIKKFFNINHDNILKIDKNEIRIHTKRALRDWTDEIYGNCNIFIGCPLSNLDFENEIDGEYHYKKVKEIANKIKNVLKRDYECGNIFCVLTNGKYDFKTYKEFKTSVFPQSLMGNVAKSIRACCLYILIFPELKGQFDYKNIDHEDISNTFTLHSSSLIEFGFALGLGKKAVVLTNLPENKLPLFITHRGTDEYINKMITVRECDFENIEKSLIDRNIFGLSKKKKQFKF